MTDETPRPPEAVPGPDGLPFLGSFLDVRRDNFGFRERVAAEYGGIARYTVLGMEVYLLSDPDLIEQVLVHDNQRYVKGDLFQRSLGPVLGTGLLNSEGEMWRRHRHLIQPAFAPDRITEYADMMTRSTVRTTADWSDGDVRDVHAEMMALTLDIVATALMGVDIRDRTPAVGAALDAVMEASVDSLLDLLPAWVPTPTRRELDEAIVTLDRVVDGIIAEKRADPGEDVVSALLRAEDDAGEGMRDEQVRDEVKTLLLAGHETTALALTFTLHLLARHPDVERNLLAELDDALGGDPPGGDPPGDDRPTPAAVGDLPYLDRVLTESMRLLPPVHAILREPTEDVTLGGYRVPAESTLLISQWVVHRDGDVYEDPEAFRPERWTDEMEADLPRLGYFPFSAGPRRCIGDRFARLEAKLVLATLLREYRFELVEPVELDLLASITSRPTHPVRMRIRERDGGDASKAGRGSTSGSIHGGEVPVED